MSDNISESEYVAAHKANEALGDVMEGDVHRLSTNPKGTDILTTYEQAELSNVDPLTELNNKKGFEKEWERNHALFKRGELKYQLFFLDMDKFKPVNDIDQSHQFGDAILKKIAEALKKMGRTEDVVARVGGDEFAVLRPGNVTQDDPTQEKIFEDKFKEKFKEEVGEEMWEKYPQLQDLGVSAGIAHPEPDDTFDSIVGRADKLMYQNKIMKGVSR